MQQSNPKEHPSYPTHDHHNCPLVARVQTLQTELAYYKAICAAYETGKLKAQGSYRRLTIQKVNSRQADKSLLLEPKLFEVQGYKEEQLKFSDRIQKRIKKGVIKTEVLGSQIKIPKHESQIRIGQTNTLTVNSTEIDNERQLSRSAISNCLSTPQQQIQQSIQDGQVGVKVEQKSWQQLETVGEPNLGLPVIRVVQEQSKSEKSEERSEKSVKPTLPLISDLCMFGCTQRGLSELPIEKLNEVQPHLVFSMFDLNSKMYYDHVAKYLFPNGLFCRRMKNQKLLSEVNQILLQNVRKHTNFIYELNSQLKFDNISGEETELLKLINPSLKLYCISIKINDFTIVDPDAVLSEKEKSDHQSPKGHQDGVASNRSANYAPKKRRKESKEIKNLDVFSNKKVISIFTYYPFFEFFESFLITIFNALKIDKLGIYQNRLDSIFKVDSGFVIDQLSKVYTPMITEINSTLMAPRLDYEFTLGIDLLKISTDGTNLVDACLGFWLYPILRLFDKNTFYDILSAILFEEQVIFVCDNQHVLSYTIYLFTQVLLRPFHYQHSIVYMVSEWDLLDAPTPIVLGVNKPSDWLNENPLREGHIYVQIGEEATLVTNRKEQKRVKSDKLRKIVSTFFKRIDKDQIVFFKDKKKKDGVEYNMSSTLAQKQVCTAFISSLNAFMRQELTEVIPDTHFIEHVKESFRWANKGQNQDAATVISEEIIAQMLKVRRDKDPFIQKFMRTQIFLTYLFDIVRLQD